MRYEVASDGALAEKLQRDDFEVATDDGWATLEWTCPRCNHDCVHRLRIGTRVFGLTASLRRRRQPRSTVEVLRCSCPQPHDGRPVDAAGCGFYARITMTAQRK